MGYVLEKRRKIDKVFQGHWHKIDDFKTWLQTVEDNLYKTSSVACNKIITCGKSELLRHLKTSQYDKNVHSNKLYMADIAVETDFSALIENKKTDVSGDVKAMEVKLPLFSRVPTFPLGSRFN